MSVLQELRRKLTEQKNLLRIYDARKKGAFAKGSSLRKRIGELESIKRAITYSLRDDAGDVRSRQQKMNVNLREGVRKHVHTSELVEMIAGEFEKSPEEDSLCGQMLAEIDAEIRRCSGELEGADKEYNEASQNYNTTNHNINNINNKIREEQAKGGK